VADRAPDEVARGSAPRAGEHPGEREERKGEVGCGDGEQAEERNGRREVPAGLKINWYMGEWGGEEREVEERGQALKRGRKRTERMNSLFKERGGGDEVRTRSITDERKKSQKWSALRFANEDSSSMRL
jgi:hypothetical protein